MAECTACGLVYDAARRPWPPLDEYYASVADFGSAQHISTGDDPEEAANVARRVERIARHLPSADASILDVGCGGGATLYSLKSAGFRNLLGLDPNEQAVGRLDSIGIPCVRADVRSAQERLGAARFDAVILSHVLEHLPGFDEVTDLVRAVLRPGGTVYAEVPDAERYPSYYGFPFHFFDKEHLQHFGLPQLELLLRRAGLAPVDSGHTAAGTRNRSIFPAVWMAASTTGVESAPTRTRPAPPAGGSALRVYVGAQEQRLRVLDNQLSWIARTSRTKLVLWGFGAGIERLWAMTRLGQLPWTAIVDRDRRKQGWRMGPHVVEPPDSLRAEPGIVVFFGAPVPDDRALAAAAGPGESLDFVFFRDPDPASELLMARFRDGRTTAVRPVPVEPSDTVQAVPRETT